MKAPQRNKFLTDEFFFSNVNILILSTCLDKCKLFHLQTAKRKNMHLRGQYSPRRMSDLNSWNHVDSLVTSSQHKVNHYSHTTHEHIAHTLLHDKKEESSQYTFLQKGDEEESAHFTSLQHRYIRQPVHYSHTVVDVVTCICNPAKKEAKRLNNERWEFESRLRNSY